MRLQVVSSNSTYYWSVTNAAPAKPYLQISNQYLPLTTATRSGIKLKVQSGNTTYRAAVYESGYYNTTSAAVGNLSSTTALTRSSTSATLTRSSTSATLTRSSTSATLTRSSTSATLTRSSISGYETRSSISGYATRSSISGYATGSSTVNYTISSVTNTSSIGYASVTTAAIRSTAEGTPAYGTVRSFIQYTVNGVVSYTPYILNFTANAFGISNTGYYGGVTTFPRVYASTSAYWSRIWSTSQQTFNYGGTYFNSNYITTYSVTNTNDTWQVFAKKTYQFSGTNLTNPIVSAQGGSKDFASFTTANNTSATSQIYFTMQNFISTNQRTYYYTNSTTTLTGTTRIVTNSTNSASNRFATMSYTAYSNVSVIMVKIAGRGAYTTVNTSSTKQVTTATLTRSSTSATLTRSSASKTLTRSSISGYATRSSISGYATRSSISGYATRSSISGYSGKLSSSKWA